MQGAPALLASGIVLSTSQTAVLSVQAFDLRWADLALVCAFVAAGGPHDGAHIGRLTRSVAALTALFLSVLAASTFVVVVTGASDRGEAAPSTGRMLITATFGVASWIVCRRQLQFASFFDALIAGSAVFLGIAVISHGTKVQLAEFLDLNINKSSVGPFVVIALAGAILRPRLRGPLRIVLVVLAATALAAITSMTASLVVCVVVPVAVWAASAGFVRRFARIALIAGAAVVAVSYCYASLTLLRPAALPETNVTEINKGPTSKPSVGAADDATAAVPPTAASDSVAGATVLHRAILMYSGYRVFLQEPITGVGWTRSDEPSVVSDPAVVRAAKERFPNGWWTLFTDVLPSGPHNALVQALAELGLIGATPFFALLALGSALAVAALRTRARFADRPEFLREGAVPATLFLCAVGFLLTNGLFPGQPETVLLSVSLAALAGTADGLQSREVRLGHG